MADTRRVGAAEQGISGMMVDLHRSFGAPLSDAMLFAWHRVLTTGRRDLERTGSYRTHPEPKQIVSDVLNEPVVHFEAPPPAAMPVEMARFINWFSRTASDGPTPLPALIRAGIAHIYFVSVHPFEDGNSRIGRAIAEKALAQNLGHPTLMALAATIMARRKAYFEALERSNTTNELTGWLMWFAETAIEAERRTIALVGFLIGKTRLMDRLKGALNPRQEKALLRVLREGPDGFERGELRRYHECLGRDRDAGSGGFGGEGRAGADGGAAACTILGGCRIGVGFAVAAGPSRPALADTGLAAVPAPTE